MVITSQLMFPHIPEHVRNIVVEFPAPIVHWQIGFWCECIYPDSHCFCLFHTFRVRVKGVVFQLVFNPCVSTILLSGYLANHGVVTSHNVHLTYLGARCNYHIRCSVIHDRHCGHGSQFALMLTQLWGNHTVTDTCGRYQIECIIVSLTVV